MEEELQGDERVRVLTFKKKYVGLILSGRKTTTIRLGKLNVRERSLLIVGNGRPIALARVEDVTYKKVKELTEEDARADGLDNLINLFRELRSIYGDFTLEDYVTIIRFSVVKVLEGGLANR